MQNRCCSIVKKYQRTCALVFNFNDSAQLYFTAGIYCLHGKLAAVWNFASNFRELPQWNHHVNGTIYERGLRSQGWP